MSGGRPRVAVTGATGLVGRHLCDHFRRGGWTVRALSRDVSIRPFEESGITVHHCDLPEQLEEEALAGVRAVVHCAWATRARDPERAYSTNVEGSRRVLRAARDRGVDRFVFLSSFAAEPPVRSGYGRGKRDVEELLDSGRDVAVRPGLVLAEGAGLYHRIRRVVEVLPVVPVVGADRPVQIVHVEDLCRAVERILERSVTGTVRIAHPEPVLFVDLLDRIAASLGVKRRFWRIPARPVLAGLRLSERVGLRLPVTSENLRGLLAQEPVATERDLRRVGLSLRSLDDVLRSGRVD